jgi:hypothetical protein
MSPPSFPQVARMQLASSELFHGIHLITEDELIRWYQEEFVRHPERMRILEALCGVKGAMT